MALNPIRKKRRNDKIKARYQYWDSKKTPKGKNIYTYEHILEKLSDQFFLSERTIHDILSNH